MLAVKFTVSADSASGSDNSKSPFPRHVTVTEPWSRRLAHFRLGTMSSAVQRCSRYARFRHLLLGSPINSAVVVSIGSLSKSIVGTWSKPFEHRTITGDGVSGVEGGGHWRGAGVVGHGNDVGQGSDGGQVCVGQWQGGGRGSVWHKYWDGWLHGRSFQSQLCPSCEYTSSAQFSTPPELLGSPKRDILYTMHVPISSRSRDSISAQISHHQTQLPRIEALT